MTNDFIEKKCREFEEIWGADAPRVATRTLEDSDKIVDWLRTILQEHEARVREEREEGLLKEILKSLPLRSDWDDKVRHLIIKSFAPTNGCENCWGDLHEGCSAKCKMEFETARNLAEALTKLTDKVREEREEGVREERDKEILAAIQDIRDDFTGTDRSVGVGRAAFRKALDKVVSFMNSKDEGV